MICVAFTFAVTNLDVVTAGYVRTVNWGSVADWVGAVGTSGALLLGIGLFVRERAIQRRAGVDGLITWLSWREVADREVGFRLETYVHVFNSGTRPIYAPLLFYPDTRGGFGSEIISDTGLPTMLPPGSEMQHVIKGSPRNTIARNILVMGEDGRVWIRKVDEHRYANPFARALLMTLLLCFERQDGASSRRRRQQARRNSASPSKHLLHGRNDTC